MKRPINSSQAYLSRVSIKSFGLYHDMIQSSGASTSLLGDSFEATVAAHHFGRLTLFDRQLTGAYHRRDTAQIRQDSFEHYYLQVLRSGQMTCGRYGEERRLVPGDAILFDATQPMGSVIDHADYVTIILARDLVEAAAPDAGQLHGRILPRGESSSLGETVLSLIRYASHLPHDLTAGSSHLLSSMLGQIQGMSDTNFSDKIGESNVDLSRRLKAEMFIESNLGKNLNADFVARSIGVSRASLYRAMYSVGGVETVVTRRRAARLRSLILRNAKEESITNSAERVGFSSSSHGLRVFKQIYGQSPSQLRAIFRADASSPMEALQPERMRKWYNTMND